MPKKEKKVTWFEALDEELEREEKKMRKASAITEDNWKLKMFDKRKATRIETSIYNKTNICNIL